MVWGILQLIFAALCFFTAGTIVADEDKKSLKWLWFNLALAILMIAMGTYDIYNYSAGKISYVRFQNSTPIYAVDGQVQTSRGTVIITEDGERNVLALWSSYENGPADLPSETKFIRITKDEKGAWRLEPVAAP